MFPPRWMIFEKAQILFCISMSLINCIVLTFSQTSLALKNKIGKNLFMQIFMDVEF